jgi:hypothetical protein
MEHRFGVLDGARADEDSRAVSQPQVFAICQMLRTMTSASRLTVKALGTAREAYFHAYLNDVLTREMVPQLTLGRRFGIVLSTFTWLRPFRQRTRPFGIARVENWLLK